MVLTEKAGRARQEISLQTRLRKSGLQKLQCKKADHFRDRPSLIWLPDLDSNQGPAD